jgi:hypothetical protein
MKLVESYQVTCCDMVELFSWKYQAIECLLKHIETSHSNRYEVIEKKGRKMTRSMNGCGYYDGNDKDTGWGKASETFREAWRKNALEYLLQRNKF